MRAHIATTTQIPTFTEPTSLGNKIYFFSPSMTAAHPPRQAEYASWSVESVLHASVHFADAFSKTTVPSGKNRGLCSPSLSDPAKAAQPAEHAPHAIGLMRRGVHAAMQRACLAGQSYEQIVEITWEGLTAKGPAY
jgi:hypothetical protein